MVTPKSKARVAGAFTLVAVLLGGLFVLQLVLGGGVVSFSQARFVKPMWLGVVKCLAFWGYFFLTPIFGASAAILMPRGRRGICWGTLTVWVVLMLGLVLGTDCGVKPPPPRRGPALRTEGESNRAMELPSNKALQH